MSALELLAHPGTTLADVARAVALADVVEKVVKQRREELRDGPLAQLASEAAQLTGSDGFTSRIEGVGQVIQTAPETKVRVSDPQAFGRWLGCDCSFDDLVETRYRVEVVDHEQAAKIIDFAGMPGNDLREDGVIDALLNLVQHCLKVTVESYPSENAVDVLLEKGWAVVRSDVVFALDPDEGTIGEPVPGLSVSRAAQRTYVKPDAKARKQVTRQVREALALDGGDQ